MIQKKKDQFWIDESGNRIPYNRLTKLELKREKALGSILLDAQAINKKLSDFKKEIKLATDQVVHEFILEKGISSLGKGNVTLFNFDRTIKVEVSISDRIEFDDLTMKACKEKFDAFLNVAIDEKQAFVKEMINDAFSTTNGKLDAKKVMSLLKYRQKIKDAVFHEAIALLEESIRRPDSKTYYRVWLKDANGEFQNIDLNFSSI
jgi:hypothetical protein